MFKLIFLSVAATFYFLFLPKTSIANACESWGDCSCSTEGCDGTQWCSDGSGDSRTCNPAVTTYVCNQSGNCSGSGIQGVGCVTGAVCSGECGYCYTPGVPSGGGGGESAPAPSDPTGSITTSNNPCVLNHNNNLCRSSTGVTIPLPNVSFTTSNASNVGLYAFDLTSHSGNLYNWGSDGTNTTLSSSSTTVSRTNGSPVNGNPSGSDDINWINFPGKLFVLFAGDTELDRAVVNANYPPTGYVTCKSASSCAALVGDLVDTLVYTEYIGSLLGMAGQTGYVSNEYIFVTKDNGGSASLPSKWSEHGGVAANPGSTWCRIGGGTIDTFYVMGGNIRRAEWTPKSTGTYYFGTTVHNGENNLNCAGNPYVTSWSYSGFWPCGDGSYASLTVGNSAPKISTLKIANATASQTTFSGVTTHSGKIAPNGSSWVNPMKVSLTVTPGSSSVNKYYVAMYNSNSTLGAKLTDANTFVTDASSRVANPQNGILLRYDSDGTFYVWNKTLWSSIPSDGRPVKNDSDTEMYVVWGRGVEGNKVSWEIRFSDAFSSKNMYTAAYLEDGSTPVQKVLIPDCQTSNPDTDGCKLITP